MMVFHSIGTEDQNFKAVIWYFWPIFDDFKIICAFHHTNALSIMIFLNRIMMILINSILAYRIQNDYVREWLKACCLCIIELMLIVNNAILAYRMQID